MTSSPGTQDVIMRRARGISKTIFVVSLVIVAAGSGLAGYYAAGGFKPAAPVITVTGDGSTFAFPIITAMAAGYGHSNPNVQINYQGVGSTRGRSDFQARIVDFAGTDAPLTTGLRANITRDIGTPLTIPESIGAVAIGYNLPGISTGLNLTVDVLAGIFQRSITQWNNASIQTLNPGLTLPNQPITVAHRSEGSGTTFIFTSWLSSSLVWKLGAGNSITWPSGTYGAQGNAGVAALVQGTKNTIGYVELNYVLTTSPPITYSKIMNPAGNYVLPSLTTTAYAVTNSSSSLPAGSGDWSSVSVLNAPGAQTYPIASFTYLLVFQELSHIPSMTQERAQALVNFLSFAVNKGQQLAATLYYVPLPQFVVTIDVTAINSITFNGQSLPHS